MKYYDGGLVLSLIMSHVNLMQKTSMATN